MSEVCKHGSLSRECFVCELTEEIDRLKAELSNIKRCPQCKVIEGEFHTKYCCLYLAQADRDQWKQKAEKLAEALKGLMNYGDVYLYRINERSPYAIAKEALAEYEKEMK